MSEILKALQRIEQASMRERKVIICNWSEDGGPPKYELFREPFDDDKQARIIDLYNKGAIVMALPEETVFPKPMLDFQRVEVEASIAWHRLQTLADQLKAGVINVPTSQ